MVSALDRVVWAQVLAGDNVLCFKAKHLTLTVPLTRPLRCINGYWRTLCWG